MVTADKLITGVAKYIDIDLMPHLTQNSIHKFFIGTACSLFLRRAETILQTLNSNKVIASLGIVKESGEIDIELLKEVAMPNIPDKGIKVELPLPEFIGGPLSLTFVAEDVEKLYNYIVE